MRLSIGSLSGQIWVQKNGPVTKLGRAQIRSNQPNPSFVHLYLPSHFPIFPSSPHLAHFSFFIPFPSSWHAFHYFSFFPSSHYSSTFLCRFHFQFECGFILFHYFSRIFNVLNIIVETIFPDGGFEFRIWVARECWRWGVRHSGAKEVHFLFSTRSY